MRCSKRPLKKWLVSKELRVVAALLLTLFVPAFRPRFFFSFGEMASTPAAGAAGAADAAEALLRAPRPAVAAVTVLSVHPPVEMYADAGCVCVRLFETTIFTRFADGGVLLSTGGHRTRTTLLWMQRALLSHACWLRLRADPIEGPWVLSGDRRFDSDDGCDAGPYAARFCRDVWAAPASSAAYAHLFLPPFGRRALPLLLTLRDDELRTVVGALLAHDATAAARLAATCTSLRALARRVETELGALAALAAPRRQSVSSTTTARKGRPRLGD